MTDDELFIHRAIQLARLGEGKVSPNPMVGAVLVYQNQIIGEGWHSRYGAAHAEVNALASVADKNREKIPFSTLYVTLEPCCIFGNTPPCTDLIIRCAIKKVVIAAIDKTLTVNGKGVQILREAGVEVVEIFLEAAREVSKYRNHFVQQQKPFVVLKFARTEDQKMGSSKQTVNISNDYTKRLSHKWRSEVDAILIGSKTLCLDNPQLTNRLYFGKNPMRVVIIQNIDNQLFKSKIFQDHEKNLLITASRNTSNLPSNTEILNLDFDEKLLDNLLSELGKRQITSLLVEGGALSLQQFIDQNLWDEARIFSSNFIDKNNDILAPNVTGRILHKFQIADNECTILTNNFSR